MAVFVNFYKYMLARIKYELNLLAFDLGVSNGHGTLEIFDSERIRVQELYRFKNNFTDLNGVW